ncbi:FAD-binding oxidoreductase [Halostreptopolyspora alba]|uniref:FAD-binding oxidoreductase n=1 Tax=Halostreptopolyspora alba TaxID=2487137 RepID=A0A3N0EEM5_9ACTN|nr:FAD-binding oxidoreductase [Nocardiopsaceae bacterium YIM 96095]
MVPAENSRLAGGFRDLRRTLRGSLLLPSGDAPEPEPFGFNRIVASRPAAVVRATGAADVRTAVRWAADHTVPVAVRATGHGVAVPADGALVIDTVAMDGVHVDPHARTARIEAGVPWGRVVREAAAYGLAPLNGAAPSVGAVGYTLGGGHGPLGRSYGYAADRVRGLAMVTPDGRHRTVSADRDPDLFWGTRGGKGNFGVVTAMEVDLFPVPRLYGGGLFFPGESAPLVLRAWRDWTSSLPDAMQSSVALIRFPDDDALPAEMRDRFLAHVRIAFNGSADEGARLVRPLRRVRDPVLDTVTEMPYSQVARIHADPTEPGVYSERSTRLESLDDTAIDTITAFAGAGGLPAIEIRHLGGALARNPEHANAVPFRHAGYTLFSGARTLPEEAHEVHRLQERLIESTTPWRIGGPFLSFIGALESSPEQVRSAYEPRTYRDLAHLKASYDPENLLRINHNIAPVATAGDEPREEG